MASNLFGVRIELITEDHPTALEIGSLATVELRFMTNTEPASGGPYVTAEATTGAVDLLRGLIGKRLVTVTGSVNTILGVQPPNVIVATTRSPKGQPVPIAWVDDALNRLRADGAVTIDPSEIGHRSSFIGAVLKSLPGARVEGSPPVISFEPTSGNVNGQDDRTGPLPDDHPLWEQHDGGGRDGREWDLDEDLPRAQAFYAQVKGKATIVLDLLIDHPGQRLSVAEIRALRPDIFENAHSVAGSMQGVAQPHRASERRYPFYWWKGRPDQTRYGMKPQVAELFRRARTSMADGLQSTVVVPQVSGMGYRPQDEDVDVAPPAPATSADPDSFGRGLRSHRRLQNQLARLVETCGLSPRSPLPVDPDYDLAWMTDDETLMVVEVKSATDGNEIRQLRMGLGQVLDYNDTLQRRGFTVQPVLYVEREPVEERWIEIAGAARVILGWPGAEERLGLPKVTPSA